MTATYTLPNPISDRIRFRSRPVNARAIKAVIPTYKDWDGLRVTLDSLLKLKTPPKKIAVANDNADDFVPGWLAGYPVDLVNYAGNVGPAKARNRGFGFSEEIPSHRRLALMLLAMHQQKPPPWMVSHGFCADLSEKRPGSDPAEFAWSADFDWVYFTDCGCTHHPDIFLEFEKAWRECGDCCVAVSGTVEGSGPGSINEFMTEQGVLNAPLGEDLYGRKLPQAIITANALVAALPFAFLGGFDPAFPEAAGEDLDMGIRLRDLGRITRAEKALVSHRFDEDDSDFYKRFRRYGRGNRRLEIKHNLPSMRAWPFEPYKKNDPEHARLAKLAVEAMQAGYDEAVNEDDRGVLRILKSQ